MKKLYLFLLISLLTEAATVKQIGKTTECPNEITIEAEEGDNNVYAVMEGERYTLFPLGNYVFKNKSSIILVFDSYNRRRPSHQTTRLIYSHPSMARKHGVIEVISEKQKYTCHVVL